MTVYALGIDIGGEWVKAAAVDAEGRLLRGLHRPGGFDPARVARELAEELDAADAPVGVVGAGAALWTGPARAASGTAALARVALALAPDCLRALDIGAQTALAVRLNAAGKPLQFVTNERCAAGVGGFPAVIARILQVPLEAMDALARTAADHIDMTAQCAVFAESEAVSLLHGNHTREAVAAAALRSVTSRLASLVRRLGGTGPLALAGGLAGSGYVVEALARELGEPARALPDPLYAAAVGSALLAGERR